MGAKFASDPQFDDPIPSDVSADMLTAYEAAVRSQLELIGESPEREGLLKPSRSEGNTRLYTEDDVERLEVILKLTRDLGVNLAGVEIILNMREKMAEMQRQIEAFVSSLNTEITSQRARPTAQEPGNSLIPVIQIRRPKKPGA